MSYYIASLGYFLVQQAIPNAITIVFVSLVLAYGFKAAFPFMFALWAGEAIWLLSAGFGVLYPPFSFLIFAVGLRVLGIVILLFVAWKIWRKTADLPGESGVPAPLIVTFLAGLALTLGDPAIGANYFTYLLVTFGALDISDGFLICSSLLFVVVVVDLLYICFAAIVRQMIWSEKFTQGFNRFCAVLLGLGAIATIAT